MSSFVALVGRVPLVAWHDDQLGETLASFRKNKSHIAVVRNVNNTGPVRICLLKMHKYKCTLLYFSEMTHNYEVLMLLFFRSYILTIIFFIFFIIFYHFFTVVIFISDHFI